MRKALSGDDANYAYNVRLSSSVSSGGSSSAVTDTSNSSSTTLVTNINPNSIFIMISLALDIYANLNTNFE